MNKKLHKRKIIIPTIVIILTLIVLLGGTFAIFMRIDEANIANNYQTGNLHIVIDDTSEGLGGNLNLPTIPLSDEEGEKLEPYKFKVINKGNLNYVFDLKIVTDTLTLEKDGCTENQIPANYIKIKLDDEEPILLSELEENILSKEILLFPQEELTYELRIWLDENTPNSVKGRHIHYKVATDGYAIGKINTEEMDKTIAYSGTYYKYVAPINGYYYVELNGSYGLRSHESTNGKGGNTSGYIFLNKNDVLYFYVGGTNYNGGGWTNPASSSGYAGVKGGGATDIRYFGEYEPTDAELLWDSTLGLNSRIMVAGGGAGSEWDGNVGGNGGGLIAKDGSSGTGGTQTSGGTGNWRGGFGYGGYTTANADGGGMGGGGYYGGGSPSTAYGGGGGSSFISGFSGVNAITSETDRTHTNNTLHYSGKYFIAGNMQVGTNSQVGNALIKYIGSKPKRINKAFDNVRYIKDCINGNSANTGNHWVELQAIKNGLNLAYGKKVTGTVDENATYPYSRITDGDIATATYAAPSSNGLQCIIVDLEQNYNLDEIAIWHYWSDGRKYKENILSVSADKINWKEVINNTQTLVSETNIGIRVNPYFEN